MEDKKDLVLETEENIENPREVSEEKKVEEKPKKVKKVKEEKKEVGNNGIGKRSSTNYRPRNW